jgi:hypothetical protein
VTLTLTMHVQNLYYIYFIIYSHTMFGY